MDFSTLVDPESWVSRLLVNHISYLPFIIALAGLYYTAKFDSYKKCEFATATYLFRRQTEENHNSAVALEKK